MNGTGRMAKLITGCLLTATCMVAGNIALAGPGGYGGKQYDHGSLPEGCKPEWPAKTAEGQAPSREEIMRKLADEYGLTGQQQLDLQVLVTDYAERLRQIATQMRDSSQRLANTEPGDPYYWTLTQEVSAQASSGAGETVILLSELREKVYQVLTAEQRAEFKRRIEERKAKCKPPAEGEASAG